MKHLLSIILFLSVFHFASADLLTDITDGKYRAKTVSGIKSMNDGEHYTLLQNNKLIVKYSYKTGQAVDTILARTSRKFWFTTSKNSVIAALLLQNITCST